MNKVFLLYSQFSSHCKELIEILPKLDDVNILCIDNPKIRKQVLSSKKFNITVVPTIIHTSNNENIIYEGDDAKNFIYNILQNQIDEQPLINTIQSGRTMLEDDNEPKQSGRTMLVEDNEPIQSGRTMLEDDNEPIQSGRTMLEDDNEPKQVGRTTIEDLFEFNDDDIEDEVEINTDTSLMDKVEEMKVARGVD
jgi:hypothetical protein